MVRKGKSIEGKTEEELMPREKGIEVAAGKS